MGTFSGEWGVTGTIHCGDHGLLGAVVVIDCRKRSFYYHAERMKKRIRKKQRIGEYTEWGRHVAIARKSKSRFDEFLDAFVEEAIVSNGCFCGGGGKGKRMEYIVELGRGLDDGEAKMKRIAAWLDARTDVRIWRSSIKFDLWHDDAERLRVTLDVDSE